ncbi:MAG: 2-C-methyl-D-erythritol 2,4-cyclodiphosphate synthase [Candidatus Eisenbacteria bacterium]|nr:2-C-methyl-D-erythritol 2,4-cyclodiphosphate synthase [Candidatus Eisenbacteria bacterium]
MNDGKSHAGPTAEDRVGIGYDLHRLVAGRPLRIGTVAIPFDAGLAGHSDADVLCHAIADALLGAARLGEIGSLFPDSDPRWEGLTGADLLARVAALLSSEAGMRIGNVDSVVIAERPRLAAQIPAMASGIAAALSVDPSRISVKVKSNEGVDATGRGEAIAAQAIVRLVPASGERIAP